MNCTQGMLGLLTTTETALGTPTLVDSDVRQRVTVKSVSEIPVEVYLGAKEAELSNVNLVLIEMVGEILSASSGIGGRNTCGTTGGR